MATQGKSKAKPATKKAQKAEAKEKLDIAAKSPRTGNYTASERLQKLENIFDNVLDFLEDTTDPDVAKFAGTGGATNVLERIRLESEAQRIISNSDDSRDSNKAPSLGWGYQPKSESAEA